MKNEKKDRTVFLTLIAGRKQKDLLLSALLDAGARLMNTVYGRGTVKASYLMNVFGLVPEENKVVILCVMTAEKADAALKMLAERFDFNRPNTGIAFTISIDSMAI